jgi:PleD family two-component response regulator
MTLRIPHGASGAGRWVTLSVGVTTHVPDNDVGPDWFLGQADQALYAAKHLGRNRVISADTMLADFVELHRRKPGSRELTRSAQR